MGQEALWLDCAEKLTAMIQNIIEFAKLIPGFMRLSQDDQVRTLLFRPHLHTFYNFSLFVSVTNIMYQSALISQLQTALLNIHNTYRRNSNEIKK